MTCPPDPHPQGARARGCCHCHGRPPGRGCAAGGAAGAQLWHSLQGRMWQGQHRQGFSGRPGYQRLQARSCSTLCRRLGPGQPARALIKLLAPACETFSDGPAQPGRSLSYWRLQVRHPLQLCGLESAQASGTSCRHLQHPLRTREAASAQVRHIDGTNAKCWCPWRCSHCTAHELASCKTMHLLLSPVSLEGDRPHRQKVTLPDSQQVARQQPTPGV